MGVELLDKRSVGSETNSRLEVNASVWNFLDKSTFYTLIWPISRLKILAQEAGYSGFEWHPIRTFAGIQVLNGLARPEYMNFIKSLHQSWRSEKSIKEVLAHPNKPLVAFSYILLPERESSISQLAQIQRLAGRRLLAVLYPPHYPWEETGTTRPFASKTFQPTPEIMRHWGVKDIDGLIYEMRNRYYDGFCLDLFHLRAQGEVSLNPWQETLFKLLPYTREIHVSVGRVDIKGSSLDTESELKDLLNGTNHTDMPKMLKAIKEFGWKGLVVTEIPASAVKTIAGSKGRFLIPRELVSAHQKIVGRVQELLS